MGLLHGTDIAMSTDGNRIMKQLDAKEWAHEIGHDTFWKVRHWTGGQRLPRQPDPGLPKAKGAVEVWDNERTLR
jgi:hypothetical protein